MRMVYVSDNSAIPQYGIRTRKVTSPVDICFETGKFANMFCTDEDEHINAKLILNAEKPIKITLTYQLFFDAYSVAYPVKNTDLCLNTGKTEISCDFSMIDGMRGVFRVVACVYEERKLISRKRFSFSNVLLPQSSSDHVRISAHLFLHERIQILRLLKKIGVGFIRDDIAWSRLEKEKGIIEPLPQYEAVAKAAKDLNVKTLIILDYGNKFYDEGKNPYTEEGIAAYAKFCYETAKHYKGIISDFEIWNEYNLLGFNPDRRSPEVYTKMLKAAYTAIKSANPGATVYTSGTCNGQPSWLKRILDSGAYDYFDAVGIHPYCCSQGPVYPDHGRVREEVEEYRDILKKTGKPEKPVVVTEIGWKTESCGKGGTPHFQASAIIRNFAISQSADERYPIFTYTDSDNDNPFDGEQHFGILENSASESPYALKEAAAAITVWVSFMADSVLKEILSKDRIYGYSATDKNNNITNIFWSKDGECKVTFSCESKEIDLFDLYGNKKSLSAKDGEYSVTVGDSPVYIKIFDNLDLKILSVEPITESPIKQDDCCLKIEPFHGEENERKIKVTVKNNRSDRDSEGILIISKNGERLSKETVKIKPNSETTVTTDVDVVNDLELIEVTAEFSTTDGEHIRSTERLRFWGIPYVETEDFFNGDFGERVFLDKKDYIKRKGFESSEITAELRFGWNREHFLIAADVTDKTHAQNGLDSPIWKDIWDGDGLQFAICVNGDIETAEKTYSEFGAAMSSISGETVVWRWKAPENRGIKRYKNAPQKITRSGEHTFYTLAIRWEDIFPKGYNIEKNRLLAFSLNVNNADDLVSDLVGLSHFGKGVSCCSFGVSGNAAMLDTMLLIDNNKKGA